VSIGSRIRHAFRAGGHRKQSLTEVADCWHESAAGMRHPSVDRMSRTVPTVATALVMGLGSAAWAAPVPAPVTLAWEAPAACPTADEVLAEVDRTLAEPGGAPTPVTARVRVSPGADGIWQASLSLELRGAQTERRFRAESCAAIASATAVILAIAVQDASEAPPNPTTTSPAQDREASLRASPPSIARTSRFFMTANGLVDWDTMPSAPAVGYEAAFGESWRGDRWRLRWIAGADLFPSHSPPDTPFLRSVNGAFWLLGVSGRGCLGVALSRLEIGPCLGAELAAMHASDGGIPSSAVAISLANQTEYWLALLGSMAASWNVSGAMDVILRADLVVPTRRAIFGLAGDVLDDYQVPAHAFRGALGIQVRFQ
jgi:hypothetical protein